MENEVQNFDNESIKHQVAKILMEHGLDFHIEKVPMVGLIGDVQIPSTYFGLVNMKSKEIINTCKSSYHVSQNADVVELVVRAMRGFGILSVQKAGSLNGGRKTFIQLGVEGFGKVGDDTIQKYVTIIDSNDGSTGLSVGIGDLTMSCSNQFFRFYKRGEMKLKHSSSLEGKMRELPSLINLALNESLRQIEVYNKFQSTACTKDLVDGLVREILGVDRITAKVGEQSTKTLNAMDSLYNNIAIEMNTKQDNIWGLFSGVTRWTSHEKSHPKRENGQLESLMVGTNYRVNIEAFKYCLAVANCDTFVLI
jgi:hypothetical protein